MRFRRIFKNVPSRRWYHKSKLGILARLKQAAHIDMVTAIINEPNPVPEDMSWVEDNLPEPKFRPVRHLPSLTSDFDGEDVWCTMSFKKCPTKWTWP